MLDISNLRKVYEDGTVAVDDLDLTVPSGEIFVLLGANGAGKTSTIMLILGFTEQTGGTVTISSGSGGIVDAGETDPTAREASPR